MANPFDYSLNTQSPLESMVGGYRAGANIAAIEQEQQARQQAMQLAAMKQQQETMLQQQRQEAFDKALGPNAGIADYRRAAIFGNDEQSKAFLSFAAEQTAEQNRGAISKIASVFYPLVAGNVDASVKALERQKEAYAGNQAAVQEIDNQIAQIQADPKTAQVRLGGMLAEIPGGEKVLENVLSLTKENRAQSEEKRAAELQPSTLMAQTAKARKAVIDSQYADLSARLSMEEKRQNIAAAKQQISDARNAGVKVQSSSILPDGTVILVTTDGQSIVRDPEGNNLTGQSRRDAIFAAKNFGVDEQGQRSGARRGAEIGQKKSEEAFESLDKVNTNIKNMNEAIAAIDGGASTGVISSKLPNVKQASIELNNIKNRLGLDVIGATTFGALSSSEREFALDTAMPTNLQPRELRAWLVRKRDAQAKMSGYLSEQAKYLSKPGRTVGDWLDYQDKKKAGNSVSVNGKTYNKPANFTDAQWQAYKRDMGV